MQRKIKFRGKEIDTGKWVYGFYLKQDTYNLGSKNTKRDLLIKDAGIIVENSKCTSGTIIDKETIGQYTGLKDRNGKEIYEGDIVYIMPEDERGIIRWDNETARYVVIYDNIISDFDNWYGKDLEVIGNKFDNPELLEEGE